MQTSETYMITWRARVYKLPDTARSPLTGPIG